MVSLKHTFQSGKADGTDDTLVKPSNWNAEHKFETTAAGVVLGRAVGAGAGPVQELSLAAMFPVGSIIMFGGTAAPTGWFICNGAAISKTTYATLYTALGSGTLYGQSGANFNLPNFTGRVPAGVGGTILNNVTFTSRNVGGTGGVDAVQLSNNHLPGHTHPVTDPSHSHTFKSDDGSTIVHPTHFAASGSAQYAGTGSYLRQAFLQGQATGITVDVNTAHTSTAHSNVQPTILITYIIKY
jgi:microcystin-dependent protein